MDTVLNVIIVYHNYEKIYRILRVSLIVLLKKTGFFDQLIKSIIAKIQLIYFHNVLVFV